MVNNIYWIDLEDCIYTHFDHNHFIPNNLMQNIVLFLKLNIVVYGKGVCGLHLWLHFFLKINSIFSFLFLFQAVLFQF